MKKIIKILIISSIIAALLNPSFNLVKSLGKKGLSLDYSEDSKNVSLNVVEESVYNYMTPKSKILNVPLISQLPDLYNGCEITSLAMLLNFKGVKINKNVLANEMKKDPTPMLTDSEGNIIKWGDPNDGFVGDIKGDNGVGYSIYPKALLPLLNKYLNNAGTNLTGTSVDTLIKYLSEERPILVWVTTDFTVPDDFITWAKGSKQIKATFSEHCVVLTGYDENNFYYNDPLNVGKNKAINKKTFETVWSSMGSLALSYENN